MDKECLTSTQRNAYTASVKRISTEAIPTSDITAQTVVADGFTLSQTDHAGITTTASRSYTATGMTMTQTDGRGNTACYRYDIRGRKSAEWGTGIQIPRRLVGGLDKPRSEFAPKGRATNGVVARQPACFAYTRHGAVQQTVTTGYGTDGHIATAGFLHGGAEKQFGYSYLSGSGLLQSLTMPNNMTLTQSYEAQRDLLTGMYYKRGATGVVEREYTYDTLGRPTARNTARQGTTKNDTFAYNNRSELTSATVSGESYSYAYDNIVNRKSAQEAVEEATAYTANALNQYTAIDDFVPTYDADGNQTLVKTTTGIWSVQYNAENRPILFTRTEADGTETQIAGTYDYMGRRSSKQVTENGSVTLNQRYIYRGYLQIAACDQTRTGHPCLWLILWDPPQPIATRPLSIQKDGTWYCYGWDLTKNICEVYGSNGYVRTAYTYTPYGSASSTGDVTQPLQWSSEYADPELGLTYYNYRHYNPQVGRWIGRDLLFSCNLYLYVEGRAVDGIDLFGLKEKPVELYDDLGNKCCSDKMKLIVKYTLRPFTKNHQVGHSFIYCPTIGYRGKYPAGNSVISNGEIQDDEPLYKQYRQTDRLVIEASYKACPASYEKMAKLIKEESENPGKYMLSGAQCEDWVNYVIEASKTPKKREQEPRINVKKSALQMPGTPDLDIKDVGETGRQSFFILRYGLNSNI